MFFLERVARVPVSLWGSGGWGCVRLTLRSRSQPSATVRNRLCDPRMAVPMGSSAEVVIFGGLRRVVASFRVASVALRGIQTCFAVCWTSFCVAGAIFLWRCQKMCCSFRGRCSTLDVSIVIFCGRRNTFRRVLLRVFGKSWAGLRQVVTRCKFRGRRGIFWHVLNIDGCFARNIDFEVANFQVLRKNRRKTSILKLQIAKLEGCLVRNARFGAQDVSHLESLVFQWLRRVYGGSCKTCLFAVSMGEAAKPCHVVVRDRRGTVWHSNLFDDVSKMSKLEDVSYEMVVYLRPRVFSNSTLYTPQSTLYTLHFTLRTSHSTLYTLHSTLHTLRTLRSALYTLDSTFHTLRSRLCTLHSTLCTLHFLLHNPHSTLYTLRSRLHTLHFTLQVYKTV